MKKLQRKALSVFLALVLLCGLFPTAYAAEQTAYSDTHGHWAEDAIARWSDYGIVQGNNGKFDPDSSMTRAQAAMVFAKLLGLEQTADLSAFADVPADAWYTDAMAKCYAAGILKGVAADRLNPEGTITREMFFVMFARAMGIEEETELNKEFSDAANISSWARGSVYALINHGYVNGVNETAIGPDNLINRASVMALLDQAITEYTVENGKPVITLKDAVQKEEEKKPTSGGSGGGGGSSGNNGGDTPPSYEDLTVSEAGTIITGGTYRNVTIAPSVGDGEVALNGVTITGNLVVQGGGSNSIKLNNCTVGGKVVLDKDSADPEAQQPRLELTDTPVSTVEVAKPAILEATDGNSAVAAVEAKANVEVKGAQTAVATVTVPATAEAPVAVTVTAGTVDKVEAKSETTVNAVGTVTAVAAEAPVTVASGSVETVTVPATVTEPVTVTVSNSASVETVDAKGATTVSAEANALVGTVAAEAPVTVSSGTVNTITVPPTASESVAITVGSGATVAEVTVRSDKGTTITNNGTVSNVSAASETIKESVAATGTPEVVSHIHVWDGGIVTTPASCTTTGSKTFKCTVDGCTSATKVEAIPATGHNWSDWTENQGADTHTRVCQNDSQHTETADHAWDNGVVTKAATCAEKGVRTYTCSTCTATKTEEIGMLPHTEVIDAAKAPSCEETGLTEGKHCSVCNAVIVAQTTVDALGHDFTVAQYDNSQHWEKCSRCDATDTKADHSYAAHNCDAAAKCQDCEYVKPAGAHSYGAYEQTKAPTCTEKGSEKAVCSVCNHEITRDVDALGHNYGAAKYTWTKSDNDTGYTCAGERVCANDASHKDQATATVASAVTKPATCTEKGETTYTATFEKDGFAQQTKTEEIPAKGHTEVIDAAVEATCTTPGKTEGKHCSVCNAVLVAQEEIPAKGHTWDNGVVTTPPTETTEGVKTYTCTVCGETRTEAIPATGGSAETISNIRFEKSDGQLYLKWDGQETDNLKYNIYLTKDGGQNWTKITSTSQLHLTMQLKDAGTYNGVKIVPRIDGVEDQSKACVDTSVLLTIGAETGTAPTKVTFTYNATKSEEWGYTENGAGAYDYTITGLTPNTPYQMEMKTALDATSVSSDGSTSNTAGTGSGTSGGSKLKTCVEQGYYRIYEFTNVQVDSSGKTVSYTATSRGDWTKCTPSASDAQQLLADAKDANLLTWLTLTEAQLPVNVTRLDMAKLVAAYMNLPVTPVPEAGFMFSDCTNANGLGDTDRGVVKAVVDAQIIMGTSSGTFDPDGTVTRAQIAELLRRMLNVPATGGTVPFTDVPSDYWAYPSIATLYNLGLISGTSPTTFEPNLIASKEAALRLLLNAKGWTDPRTPVAAVSGFTFVKTDDTLRTKITKPDVGAIERFEFAFLNSTDGQWKYVGGCGAQDNGIPIYADLPTGTYTKVRVTSVPNDFTKNLPGDAEFNCNLTITNTSGVAPASVEFTEVTDSNNNSGYSVTVKGLALATKQTVVVLAERKNGDGRRGNMSGDKFSDVTPSDKSVTITIYDQFDARLIPNGYYQVLEVLDANVGSNETTGATGTTATLKVNARGGWEKVNVGNLPATSSSISNIRFEELSGGLVALEWDFTRGTDVGTSSVMFRVIAEGPNGEHVNSGTGRTEAHLTFPAGTYTSFTVKAVDTRNQNTVFATATESLTMNVASGATSNTASAAFTKDGTEYQTVISGLSGYLAYHIYVEVPDGNGIRRSGSFGPVENAGSAMGYLPAEDIEAAGAKYSIYGVKAYTLNNGVLSYTIDCLREPTATLPAESGAPSNLHFELNQQGRFLLKWDGEEKTGVSYHLYRTSDGGNSWINCGNYSTAQAMPIFSSGNFNGFKVVPCLDNVEDESKALIDLTMRLDITPKTGTTVPTLSLARDDAKSQSFNYGPEGGYYNYSISGLAPNAAFQLYLSPDKKVSVARMGVAGENGSLISSIQGSGIKANVEGYCMVYQYTDTQIQDSGKTCTYTVTKMNDWVSVADMACQHQWDEGVVTQKPTGQNTGVKTYTCQKCGLTRTEVIPVLTEPYLTVEGGSVILHWKAELDSSEYCYINGERASKSMMNGWYYYGIPSDITESQSIVIGKGTDSEQTEVLYTLKDAVNVTILPEQNFTITGLENGKYQIAAPGMNTDGFYFKSSVKDEAGKLGDNSFSAFDGVVEMSPWEGCTVDVLLSRTSVNDAQNVVTIEKTPVATVTEITHYVPADVAEVSTFDDMVAALKRGGTVRLMADITETKTYSEIETGPAATLELDGHTLNISTYLSFNWGKDLTIIGNNASGARGQINGEIRIQNGAQLHVTGGQYEKFYCYRARDIIMEDAIVEYNGTNSNGAVSMYSCDTVELRNCNVTAETTQALDITQSGAVTLLGGSYQSTSTSSNSIKVEYCATVRAENVTASSTGGSAATYGYTPSIVVEGGSYTSTSTSYAALYVYNNEGEAYVRGTSDQPLQVSGVKCALECRVKNVWITDVNASGQCTGNLVSVQGASYGEQNAVITRLTANGGKYALSVGSIYDVTVDSCVLNADSDLTGTYGLSIMGRSNYSGSKAVVKATSASGDYGIRVNGCDNLRITSSTAAGSAYSLYLNDCTNASVTGGELNGNVHLANQSQQPIEYTLSNLNVKGCLEAIGNYGSAKTDVELSDCNFVALAADEAVVYADNLAYITISGGSYTACNEDGYVLKSNPYSSNSACITVNGGSFRNTAASANVFAPLNNDVTDARYVVNGGSFSAALSGVSGITVNGNVNTSTDEGGETVYTVTVV